MTAGSNWIGPGTMERLPITTRATTAGREKKSSDTATMMNPGIFSIYAILTGSIFIPTEAINSAAAAAVAL